MIDKYKYIRGNFAGLSGDQVETPPVRGLLGELGGSKNLGNPPASVRGSSYSEQSLG
jgi:hypothetical protein